MSTISENVIPGNHGKIFETDASSPMELQMIKKAIESLQHVKAVELNTDEYPNQFTVYTSDLVSINEIQEKAKEVGYHALPKTLFSQ